MSRRSLLIAMFVNRSQVLTVPLKALVAVLLHDTDLIFCT